MAAKRSVLITGCSEGGLGDALARAFHNQGGFRVLASARNPKKMAHFESLGIETIVLDVSSKDSIDAAVKEVSGLTGGKLDMLLNNSGKGYMIPILDADIEEAKSMFDLNVFNNITLTQAFFPLLRSSAPGSMVVNNTSVASVIAMPGQGLYAATKAAMAMVNDALRVELTPFGIKVVDLKTGGVKSKFFDNASKDDRARLPPNSVYEPGREAIESSMNGDEMRKSAADQDVWAKQVVSQLAKTSVPAQVWRGGGAFLLWAVRTFLPYTSVDNLMAKMSGINIVTEALKTQKKQA